MKKITLILFIAILTTSCNSFKSEISAKELKTIIIGEELYLSSKFGEGSWWKFNLPSEIIEIKIIDQNISGKLNELTAEYTLQDSDEGYYYYLKAKHVLRYDGDEWNYVDSYVIEFYELID